MYVCMYVCSHTLNSVSASHLTYRVNVIKPSHSAVSEVAVLTESMENLTVPAVSKMQRVFSVTELSFKRIWV
jgi:hypothetical protein